ncbi:MAG: TetR/AcrR family transcriptional regulator [Pseudobdellovibrionaceae bacterium]
MSRQLKVPRLQALNSALIVFWSKGYNATTVDDLQKAIGIQRGSFYFHFKDKRTLFFEALDYYKKTVVDVRRDLVRDQTSAKKGIELYFKTLIDHSIKNKAYSGCLNTNTATELGLSDAELADRLGFGIRSWQKFWEEILQKAVAQKEISNKLDVESTAQLLIAMTQGLNVIVKVNSDRKFLEGVVKAGLRVLEL